MHEDQFLFYLSDPGIQSGSISEDCSNHGFFSFISICL